MTDARLLIAESRSLALPDLRWCPDCWRSEYGDVECDDPGPLCKRHFKLALVAER